MDITKLPMYSRGLANQAKATSKVKAPKVATGSEGPRFVELKIATDSEGPRF